jgi:hypothetical protein
MKFMHYEYKTDILKTVYIRGMWFPGPHRTAD